MMKHVFKNNNACNSWCAGVTDMKNVLPPFRPPQAAPSVSAADVIEADIRKHGFTEKTRQRKEAETRLVALKSRPKERDVYLNGWPLDPPHLRHTVVFDGKYPDRVVEGEAGALSDTQLALADSGHRLVDDAARSSFSEVRSLAVSLLQTDLTVPIARLAETQAHASTVRIPLPQELAQTSKLRKSLLGKVELPQVVIPQAPIRSMPSSNPLRSAVAGVTSRHKKSLSHDSLPLTANTFLVCNCNMVGPAEVYTAIARTVSHTLLPPLTATSFPSSWAQVSPGDSTFPARVPFHLPPTCAVLYDELYASEVYDSSDGRHVFIGGASPSSAPLLAPFTESSVFSSDPPPSATSGLYTAFLPGVASLTLRLPPSILDNVPVTIKFVNTHRAHTVEVYWVDYDGNLVIRRLLNPGEKYNELTWATHPWVIRNPLSQESLLVCCGPGAIALPMSTSLLWSSAPTKRSVSISFESDSVRRLVGASPSTSSLVIDSSVSSSGTVSGLLQGNNGSDPSVVVMESSAKPGLLDSIPVEAALERPKVTITVVDDVPANPMEGEFLKRAFAARALKTAKMTKRK